MGSFAYTCSISGLPIESGDAVRFLLLQASPFGTSGSYAKGPESWYVRTPPIRATYNDYGTVEDYETGPVTDAWIDAFNFDMVEKGLGDNTYHDVPTRKGMTFDAMLEALREDRIEVRDSAYALKFDGGIFKSKIPRGVPTLRRIEKVISSAGLKLGDVTDGYVLDQLRRGEIRVRAGNYAGDKKTAALFDVLARKLRKRYAVMIACGSGNYADCGEMTIRPKLGTKRSIGDTFVSYSLNSREEKRPQSLQVRQAMIREDVWQALCGLSTEGYDKDYKTVARRVDVYHASAAAEWAASLKQAVEYKDNPAMLRIMSGSSRDRSSLVAHMLAGNPSINGAGVNTFWQIVLGKGLDAEQVKAFTDTVGELAMVESILSTVRFVWRPAGSDGPQDGQWEAHRAFLEALIKVTDAPIAKAAARAKEDE